MQRGLQDGVEAGATLPGFSCCSGASSPKGAVKPAPATLNHCQALVDFQSSRTFLVTLLPCSCGFRGGVNVWGSLHAVSHFEMLTLLIVFSYFFNVLQTPHVCGQPTAPDGGQSVLCHTGTGRAGPQRSARPPDESYRPGGLVTVSRC